MVNRHISASQVLVGQIQQVTAKKWSEMVCRNHGQWEFYGIGYGDKT